MNRTALAVAWQALRRFPAWMTPGLWSAEAEDYFDDLETARADFLKAAQRQRNAHSNRPMVDLEWANGRRREYLADQVSGLKKSLVTTNIDLGKAAKSGDAFSAAMANARLGEIKIKIRKFENALKNLSNVTPAADRLTEDMILRAREYPIRKLIAGDRDQISCPFHADTSPSASVKKGFFYCFSCSTSLDAIGWLMKVENYSYPDAVRKLSGES